MAPERSGARHDLANAFQQLDALRFFRGAPGDFWQALLRLSIELGPATAALIYTRTRSPDAPGVWKESFAWPPQCEFQALMKSSPGETERLLLAAETGGASASTSRDRVAVKMAAGDPERFAILVTQLRPGANADDATARLRLLADLPLLYERNAGITQATEDSARFAVTLDVLALLNSQTRFAAAAMALCNEAASRFACARVSLGWLRRGSVKLQAVSHTEHFEKKMALVAAIEEAMDEACEQNEEVAWPAPAGGTTVARCHEAMARAQATPHVLSVPIPLGDAPAGVLTLERAQGAFSDREVQVLQLLCAQVARRLHDLKMNDRWWGARAASAVRRTAARFVGPEHTIAKLVAGVTAALLLTLVFVEAEHRVEAPFILKSDVLAQVPAPFDGYLEEVHVRVGDPVRAGQPLVTLDSRELLLNEAAALAERRRYLAEEQKAQAENNTAAMRIARASADEAQARLDVARYHLSKAIVAAPFDGHVVEGDPRERISSPVRQGEVLVKIAKLGTMFAQVAVPEADVHFVSAGLRGEIAFASRPQVRFPVRLDRIDPIASVRDGANTFTARAEFDAMQSWWRPGMSGVCKVDAGRRTLLWIYTHRSADYLRLRLWW
jgi:RND family efflux transporter MFP subunit